MLWRDADLYIAYIVDSISSNGISPLEYMDCSIPTSFFLSPVTANEIQLEVAKLNISKTSGPFSIPTKLLKILYCNISEPLEILYNCSFSTCVVPDKFKIAQIVPVFKNGSAIYVNNYRPISLSK